MSALSPFPVCNETGPLDSLEESSHLLCCNNLNKAGLNNQCGQQTTGRPRGPAGHFLCMSLTQEKRQFINYLNMH